MEQYFSISWACTTKYRPAVSYKIRDYFSQFFIENLLEEKHIIIGGKWRINITIYFVGEGRFGLSKDIRFFDKPKTVKDESVKLYEVNIPVSIIQGSEKRSLKVIEVIYEAISIFFVTTFKKISKNDMEALWNKVDLTYLLALPYPAPIEEQKFVGDIVMPDGTIKNVIPIPD